MTDFRWIMLALLGTALGMSAYHRRKAHLAGTPIARRAEGLFAVLARLLIALPLFGSVLTYIIRPQWLAGTALALPSGVRWSGVFVGAAGAGLAGWALARLGSNVSETVLTRPGQQLITAGPYRRVRHPLYSGGLLLFLGLGLIAADGLILALAGAAALLIAAMVIPREERELQARFGYAYTEYAARTGRLLPRWRRSDPPARGRRGR